MHVIAIDTETTGVLWHDTAFCATSAEYQGDRIDCRFYDLSDDLQALRLVKLLQRGVALVGHNIKFDLQKLMYSDLIQWENIWADRIEDTMVMAHLINENGSRKLKDLARDILGETTDEEATLKEYRRKAGLTIADGYDKIPIEILMPYALKDAEHTIKLYHHFLPLLKADPELYKLYRQEIALLVAVLKIETCGLGIDRSRLKEGIKEYGTKIIEAKAKIQEITGKKVFDETDLATRPLSEPVVNKLGKVTRTSETKAQAHQRALDTTFNPNSPAQILQVFQDLGYPLENTDKVSLSGLNSPLADAILELREATKVRSTYLLGIEHEAGEDDILHPNFRTTGTVTGRMSSGSG